MTASTGAMEARTLRLDPVQAVASFFRDDPARILAVADHLRAPDRTLESTVQGGSMGATLPPGSRIRIQLAQRSGYAPGEVVAFLAGDRLVVHRVIHRCRVGAGRGFVVTRGDATLAPDQPVAHGHVIGAVTAIQRGEGWIAVPPPTRRSLRARLFLPLLAGAVIAPLPASPRAAAAVAELLHRATHALRRAPSPPGTGRGGAGQD